MNNSIEKCLIIVPNAHIYIYIYIGIKHLCISTEFKADPPVARHRNRFK